MATGDMYADHGMPRGVDSAPGTIQPRGGSGSVKAKDADVSTPSEAYNCMAPKWNLIDTVLGGTATMRAAGKVYLPQHQYESQDNYDERLSRATLKNYTARTLENLSSKAFRDPPELEEDVPAPLMALMDDVDTEGSSFLMFANTMFTLGIRRAFCFGLVDHSRSEVLPGVVRTLADDEAEGVRPFWRIIDPADMLFIRSERVGGKTRIAEARFLECETVPDGFVMTTVERIRVLRPGMFELWEKRVARRGMKPKWVIVDSGPMSLDYVPIVAFYTTKSGLAEAKPPLEDLAYLNVEHFQSSADQRSILTVARFPILAVSGATTGDPNAEPIVIGPKKWLSVADSQGRIYYVEHAGKAIEAGRTDLEDLEDQMASYGSEFLRKRPGASSATGRALDSAEAISSLMAWGMNFKDVLETMLKFTADWLKLPAGGTVTYQIKPDVSVGESKELDILDAARTRRDISRVSYLRELQRKDVLSPEFEADEDLSELGKEPPPVPSGTFSATLSGGGSHSEPPRPSQVPPIDGGRGPARTSGDPPVQSS